MTLESDQASYQVGESGTLRLFIEGVNEELDGFLAGVTITGGTGLAFDPVQVDGYMFDDSSYIFHGRSNNVFTGTAFATVTMDALGVDFLDVSDDGLGGSDPYRFDNDSRLLAQFTFQARSAGEFLFELTAGSTFTDSLLNLLDISVVPSQVTVTAVPEPSSILAVATLLVCSGLATGSWPKRSR